MGIFGINDWEHWDIYGWDDLTREFSQAHKRRLIGDHFPQGYDPYVAILEQARREGKGVRITAKKTVPNWTWYIQLI